MTRIKKMFNEFSQFKQITMMLLDFLLLALAFWLAVLVRNDNFSLLLSGQYWLTVFTSNIVSILLFSKFSLYRSVLKYIGLHGLATIFFSVLSSAFILIFLSFFLDVEYGKVVPLLYIVFSLLFIGGTRLIVRATYRYQKVKSKNSVVVYGAGASGAQIANALNIGHEYEVIAFIDDDTRKQGSIVQGIKVYGRADLGDLLSNYIVEKLIIAIPSAKLVQRKNILNFVENYPVPVFTVPSMSNILSGNSSSIELQEVDLADLLGREAVSPTPSLMTKNICDKVVLVTGAGGSIGSELCRQIIHQSPSKLILLELSEFALYSIESELRLKVEELKLDVEVIPLLGSIQKEGRIKSILKTFNVDTIYHAAAYKHVPLVEHNIIEGIRNNIFGTLFLARSAIEAKVETFVLISTDKAVRPTNVMGASKRFAELILQALSEKQNCTRFCMVRFGNVLGSSGSVVPLFRKQIAKGGPITLTHNDITRFFMSIPEAAQLVIQAGAMGQGGDVFVLDMGEPVKIRDLALKMIHLSGLTLRDLSNPEGDIEIVCSGLRPGEKLYEELLIGENVLGTEHERIMRANEVFLHWDELNQLICGIDEACHSFDVKKVRDIMLEAPLAFKPSSEICDLLWEQS